MNPSCDIRDALRLVPAGRWVVGVSGGVDSVALVIALRTHCPDVEIIIAHVNHEARGQASDDDQAFVETFGNRVGARVRSERLSAIAEVPSRGHEAAYRAVRQRWFARLVKETCARGVMLAHHADDRAETVLLRLLRGGEASALGGLRQEATVSTPAGALRVLRPLLGIRRNALESFARSVGQSWREDASNASHAFARNRVRSFLKDRPQLIDPLLRLADAGDEVRTWARANTPHLGESFAAESLGDWPDPLARAAARRWLVDRGSPAGQVSAEAADRLIEMCRDRSTPATRDFVGGVQVRRKSGRITHSVR